MEMWILCLLGLVMLIFWLSFMKVSIGLVSSCFIGLILFLHEEEKFLYSLYIKHGYYEKIFN